MVEDLRESLKRADGFGRKPIERAFHAWDLCPPKQQRHREQLRACLRQLAIAHLLLVPASDEQQGPLREIAGLLDVQPAIIPSRSPSRLLGEVALTASRRNSTLQSRGRGVSFIGPQQDLYLEAKSDLSQETRNAFTADPFFRPMEHRVGGEESKVAKAVLALLHWAAMLSERPDIRDSVDHSVFVGASPAESTREDAVEMQPTSSHAHADPSTATDWKLRLARDELGATLRLLARVVCPIIEKRDSCLKLWFESRPPPSSSCRQ